MTQAIVAGASIATMFGICVHHEWATRRMIRDYENKRRS